jgi:hypothetical protein
MAHSRIKGEAIRRAKIERYATSKNELVHWSESNLKT